MNINDFSAGKRLKRVEIDTLLEGCEISDKLRLRLSDLKKKYTSEDAILYYCSERHEWDAGMGSEGYILVRDNEIVDGLVLRMN